MQYGNEINFAMITLRLLITSGEVMSHNLSLQESPEFKARLLNYLKGDDSFASPRKIDVLYTDSPASGAFTESILESVLLRKGLSSRSFHIENQMLKPCLASEMLVTRLNFKRVGDSISCEIDGQDFQRSSGSAELSQFLAALGRSARTASDSMLIISGLEHCVADLGDGYATLKFAASEDRGFQRVFAEVSPRICA